MINRLLQSPIVLLTPATLIPRETCESQGEPSNRDTMKVLQNMNISLNTKLDLLNDTIESLKGDVFDLQRENARLKAQLDQRQKGQEALKAQVQEAVFNAKLAEERSERNKQYSRRNNIKVLFIKELVDSFESAEKSEEKALRVFHDKLGPRYIKPEHIEAAHRVGKKVEGKTRPIIVKFVSRKMKQDVIKNR